MHQIRFRLGELKVLPRPLAGFKGSYLGREGKGGQKRRGKGGEGERDG